MATLSPVVAESRPLALEPFAEVFDLAPVGLALVSLDRRCLRVNRRYCEITGYTSEELCALPSVDALTHPDDRDLAPPELRRLVLGEIPRFAIHARWLRRDGGVIRVHLRVSLQRDEDGSPRGLICALEDVTTQLEAAGELAVVSEQSLLGPVGAGDESLLYRSAHEVTARARADARLRASEERYRGLVESLDEIVYTVDFDGRLTFVNQAVTHFGYTPAALIGAATEPLIHPDDRQLVAEARERVLAGATVTLEYRMVDSRGEAHAMRDVARLRRDDAGRPIGLSGVMVDLSRQRSLEEQLRVAQKMEAVGRLAGGVAHDFNNLLTVIESYAELAAESMDEGDPLASDLQEIRRAAGRAAILTRQLLAFSRKSILRPEVLDVSEVVVGVEKMLRRLIGEDVELVVTTGKTSPVKADRGQLDQILMNLAVNARDAMPEGGRLEIATADVDLSDAQPLQRFDVKPGPYVRIRVTDTGCGMDEATLSRIFEPFYTTKGPGKGTGLGLATVYGIVRQSEGAVRVRSEVGRGTTFEIDLPVVHHVVVSEGAHRAASPRAVGHETILVVEDEADVRVLVKRLLESAGFDVLAAASPKEAEALFAPRAASVDLLLTDVVMPGMNGRVLADRLRTVRPSLRVLYMSGYNESVLGPHGVVDDGLQLLLKPFAVHELAEAVRRALDRHA